MKLLTPEANVDETARLIESTVGAYVEIGAATVLLNTHFGDYSYACQNCIFQNVNVGKFSNIAAHVRIGATDHPMERPTLHHFTYRSKQYGFAEDDTEFFAHRASRTATIGHDTWLGHGAIIKPGVTVGNGAVVGSGAVVTKDVSPYVIVVGNPARLLRYRFNNQTIEALEKIQWWDWPHEVLKERLMDFRGSIESFVEKYNERG